MAFSYLTYPEFQQICRSRVPLPRAAKRVGLSVTQVEQVKRGRLSYAALMGELYPDGLRVRLDAPMASEVGSDRAPAAGSYGNMISVDSERMWSVWWENGSNLNLLVGEDQFTVVGPAQWPDRLVCTHAMPSFDLQEGETYTLVDQRRGRLTVAAPDGQVLGDSARGPLLPAGCFRAAELG